MAADSYNYKSNTATKQDDQAIRKLISRFVKGIRTLDADLVSSIFHPRALSFSPTSRGVCIEPVETWPETLRIAREDSNHVFREEFSVETLAIDIAGAVAIAKVEWTFESCRIVDFYNLLKMEGGWLIANQVYNTFPLSKIE